MLVNCFKIFCFWINATQPAAESGLKTYTIGAVGYRYDWVRRCGLYRPSRRSESNLRHFKLQNRDTQRMTTYLPPTSNHVALNNCRARLPVRPPAAAQGGVSLRRCPPHLGGPHSAPGVGLQGKVWPHTSTHPAVPSGNVFPVNTARFFERSEKTTTPNRYPKHTYGPLPWQNTYMSPALPLSDQKAGGPMRSLSTSICQSEQVLYLCNHVHSNKPIKPLWIYICLYTTHPDSDTHMEEDEATVRM